MLKWNNPNNSCSDDAVKYYLYFAETVDDELTLKDSVKIMSDTIFTFDNLTSIAGCWAITAVDSFGNESLKSAKMCADNCPEYELPNVITVNGDGVNDFFKPIKNKFIRDIDLKVYNRWGNLVFETTDPAIMWDGKTIQTKPNLPNRAEISKLNSRGIRPRKQPKRRSNKIEPIRLRRSF